MELTDSFGRQITYLRLSVTDRCNLRCRYCMPAHGVPKLCHDDILSFEDMLRIARQSVALGIEKIRVTGGEPLVRKGVVDFLGKVAEIPGLKELVLTTNGTMLAESAKALRLAGVQRLNVSLDSLKPETFAAITRGGDLSRVLRGIAAAEDAGFPPIKINTVVMRGVNDNEILEFVELSQERGYTVRFIEYMPTTRNPNWKSLCMTGEEVLKRIRQRYELEPLESRSGAGPSRNFTIPGARGAIGIISPISQHFCGDCNRIRVTSTGVAKGCLFAKHGTDLKPYLRCGDDGYLRDMLHRIVGEKPSRHLVTIASASGWRGSVAMSQIGG